MATSVVAAPVASPLRGLVPGVLVCVTVALAARFLSDHYGGPLMLYALLFGTAFNFLTEDSRCLPGIEFTAKTILRIGVGASALALSAVMPAHAKREEDLIVTVVGVTVLSTLAMVLYPMVVHALGLSDVAAGVFFGATIHDVAQVIGAGYLISDAIYLAAFVLAAMWLLGVEQLP